MFNTRGRASIRIGNRSRTRTPFNIDPGNRYAYAPDLGTDKIMIYELDLTHGKLKPNSAPWAQVHAGAGPRHFDFHPNGRWGYAINELDSTMTAFDYDSSSGALTEIGSLSTLPHDFNDTSHCADVHVSPSGKFVYGSNRGHDSIVIFAVDERTGGPYACRARINAGRNPAELWH